MRPLRIIPDLRTRVWGGTRLSHSPEGGMPIGEAWLAGPSSQVLDGPAAGATLDELAASLGARLTGCDAPDTGRFPLLAKIIDPAEWLSVQVHPDDEQARRLEGPSAVGKTEAWYVIDAAPGAEGSCWAYGLRWLRRRSGRPSARGASPTCWSGAGRGAASHTSYRPGRCTPSAPGSWCTRSSSPPTSRTAATTGAVPRRRPGPSTWPSRSNARALSHGAGRCAPAPGRWPAASLSAATHFVLEYLRPAAAELPRATPRWPRCTS